MTAAPTLGSVTVKAARSWGVTDREYEVLVLVNRHLTNAAIAEALVLSERTVESHLSSLIRKLNVSDRRSLARRAEQLGLLRGRGRWPVAGSGFVGREDESAVLAGALTDRRMVTVTGPGGVGKTRLAARTAERVARERPDGGWFVDLSQVTDARAVVPTVASAIGVVERPGRSIEEALDSVLAGADGLLMLDNCEHLLAEVERCLGRLLAGCPDLTVLATSRARLGASYEWVYELPGLSEADAVQLFCDRASAAGGAVPQDRSRVAELCRRLEGMALAIELAAARYPSLGLDGLAAGLDDPLRLLGGSAGGARQRSLRSTIAWSVALLDHDDRSVFEACSVFASEFTVAAARQLFDPAPSGTAIAAPLAGLADQHLLQVRIGEPTRYRFQEVVRQYADERLGPRRASIQAAHAAWVARELDSLAERDRDDAWGLAFDALAVEARAVLDRRAAPPLGERFAAELVLRGRLEEAQRRFERLAAEATATNRCGCCGWRPEQRRPGWWETRRCACSERRRLQPPAPGIMPPPPTPSPGGCCTRPWRPGSWPTHHLPRRPRRPWSGRGYCPGRLAGGRDRVRCRCHHGCPRAIPAPFRTPRGSGMAAAAGAPDRRVGRHWTGCAPSTSAVARSAALDVVNQRGRMLAGVPLDATSAYAFNDFL